MHKRKVAPWRQGMRLLEGQTARLVSTCVHNNRTKEQGNKICFSFLPTFPPLLLSIKPHPTTSPTPTLKPLSQGCSLHILGNLSTLKGCFSSDSLQIPWHFPRKQESCLLCLGDPHKANWCPKNIHSKELLIPVFHFP